MLLFLVEQSEMNTVDIFDETRSASDASKKHVRSRNLFERNKVFTTDSLEKQKLEGGILLLLLSSLFYISSSGFLL